MFLNMLNKIIYYYRVLLFNILYFWGQQSDIDLWSLEFGTVDEDLKCYHCPTASDLENSSKVIQKKKNKIFWRYLFSV